MKNLLRKFTKSLTISIQALFLIVGLNACEQDRSALRPKDPLIGARTRPDVGTNWEECPEGYHYDNPSHQCVPDNPPVDCSQYTNVDTRERNRAVASYGQDGGNYYDQIKANSASTASILGGYSQSVNAYYNQVRNAIAGAGSDYAATFPECSTCQGTYNSSTFLSYIDNRINPVKNTIINDGSLSSNERDVLLKGIQALYDNFGEIGSIVENHEDCYPNPAWYGSSFSAASGGVGTNGIFSGYWKKVKKNINIIATCIAGAFEYGVRGAIFGIPGGSLGVLIGAVSGGILGVAVGIIRVNQGIYVCILPPCV